VIGRLLRLVAAKGGEFVSGEDAFDHRARGDEQPMGQGAAAGQGWGVKGRGRHDERGLWVRCNMFLRVGKSLRIYKGRWEKIHFPVSPI
jgi:hypothetical protein